MKIGELKNPKCIDSEPLTTENVKKEKEMLKKLLEGGKKNEKQKKKI
jgi:hypothetical protein